MSNNSDFAAFVDASEIEKIDNLKPIYKMLFNAFYNHSGLSKAIKTYRKMVIIAEKQGYNLYN